MIGNFQIRVLKLAQGGILLIRSVTGNCTEECSESRKDKFITEVGAESFFIKCYLMESYSNGVEVATGSDYNFTLVSPFDEALNGFNCTGINHY